MSAAVALPRLIRKLQCSSDTCASPTTSPRQPAASISCQALPPGGFLKVEPPVRLLIGWVASRDFGDLVHLGRDRARIAARACEHGFGEYDVVGRAAVAVAVVHVAVGEDADVAAAIHTTRLDQRILGFATIGAAVHAERTADRAGDAAHEGKPGERGLLRGARNPHVGHRGAGAHALALDLDVGEAAAKPDDDARHAAVAHDQVGAEPDDGDGDVGRKIREDVGKVVLVLRHEQHLRRPADAKPGQRRQRLVGQQPPAQFWRDRFQARNDVGKRHGCD